MKKSKFSAKQARAISNENTNLDKLPAYSMIYDEYLVDKAIRLSNSKTRTKK